MLHFLDKDNRGYAITVTYTYMCFQNRFLICLNDIRDVRTFAVKRKEAVRFFRLSSLLVLEFTVLCFVHVELFCFCNLSVELTLTNTTGICYHGQTRSIVLLGFLICID